MNTIVEDTSEMPTTRPADDARTLRVPDADVAMPGGLDIYRIIRRCSIRTLTQLVIDAEDDLRRELGVQGCSRDS